MAYDTRFGPNAQIPEQRALVLAQMDDAIPRLKTNPTAAARQLYARYVAGELSWLAGHEALYPLRGRRAELAGWARSPLPDHLPPTGCRAGPCLLPRRSFAAPGRRQQPQAARFSSARALTQDFPG